MDPSGRPSERQRPQWGGLALALSVLLPAMAPAGVTLPPDWQVGETARVEVLTPVEIVVVDPTATATLRNREAQRIPPVYRLDPNAAEEAVRRLNEVWAANRDAFQGRIEKSFGKKRLGDREIGRPAFERAIAAGQQGGKGFPLTTNLADRWARRLPDGDLLAGCELALRGAMSRFIRKDQASPAERVGAMRGGLVVALTAQVSDVAAAETNGQAIARTNVVGLSKARTEFVQSFGGDDASMAPWLASLLRPNCVFDEALTLEARQRRTEPLWSSSRFEPGSVIVRPGEVVDARIKAALDSLREKVLLAGERPAPPRGTGGAWLWMSVAGAAAVLLVGGVAMRLRRRRTSLLPVPVAGAVAGSAEVGRPGRWLSEADRAALMSHLAQWLGRSLVEKLFRQRQHLIETQSEAARQARELEQRLAVVQQQTEDRFRAYQERIAELERELSAAEEDNRDLIRAKLTLAREEFEATRRGKRVDFN